MSEEYIDETDWLKPLGFTPGRAVVFNDQFTFTLGDLLDSLCASTFTHPKAVIVPVDINTSARIVIDMARRMWVEDEYPEVPTGEVVYNDTPDWYMEGQVQQSATRVRLYVIACDGSHIDSGRLQFITEEPASDGIIRVVCID